MTALTARSGTDTIYFCVSCGRIVSLPALSEWDYGVYRHGSACDPVRVWLQEPERNSFVRVAPPSFFRCVKVTVGDTFPRYTATVLLAEEGAAGVCKQHESFEGALAWCEEQIAMRSPYRPDWACAPGVISGPGQPARLPGGSVPYGFGLGPETAKRFEVELNAQEGALAPQTAAEARGKQAALAAIASINKALLSSPRRARLSGEAMTLLSDFIVTRETLVLGPLLVHRVREVLRWAELQERVVKEKQEEIDSLRALFPSSCSGEWRLAPGGEYPERGIHGPIGPGWPDPAADGIGVGFDEQHPDADGL